MIQAHHHLNARRLRLRLPASRRVRLLLRGQNLEAPPRRLALAFAAVHPRHHAAHQPVVAEPPRPVHAWHRAQEVIVRHVRQRRLLQRRLPFRGFHLGPGQLHDALLLRTLASLPGRGRDADRLKRAVRVHPARRRRLPFTDRGCGGRGTLGLVSQRAGAAPSDAPKVEHRGEDALAGLQAPHGARDDAGAVAEPLDVREQRLVGAHGEEEVAVHGVGEEAGRHGGLRGDEHLGEDGAAKGAPAPERLVKRRLVDEDVAAVLRGGAAGDGALHGGLQ
ncbi:hypothetical protein ISF_06504 [Cordyceps fumosorosea ARSEF 2679]|uniref:Uncharacterized protein n=1 Tax=Cordyceps fumosorosea (strain ARSEF 2679) TaxID=1081104 RepID=A0A167RLT2_CORFA|nr:hypothetical protein ISF_06504 [Cordyceps fumosorosea ARSEF 2679]OAA58721.1 hypothetical protein ISF_06504 [Cordyceps fumosorosea ARSEF 2679]